MPAYEDELRRYYDDDAAARNVRPLDQHRVARRGDFIQSLKTEHRHNVLEIGTGTGTDGLGFVTAGLHFAGVDLSPAHVHLCTAKGLNVSVASARELPFAADTFEAGWTMSTLIHIPNSELDAVLAETRRVLVPGAPLAIGLWGGDDAELLYSTAPGVPQRFFSFRSEPTLRSLLRPHGTIEHFASWHPEGRDRPYQFVVLRTAAR